MNKASTSCSKSCDSAERDHCVRRVLQPKHASDKVAPLKVGVKDKATMNQQDHCYNITIYGPSVAYCPFCCIVCSAACRILLRLVSHLTYKGHVHRMQAQRHLAAQHEC